MGKKLMAMEKDWDCGFCEYRNPKKCRLCILPFILEYIKKS